MDLQDQQALMPFLQPGESLFWAGRPQSGFVLTKADIVRIPFSLLWGGFAAFWEITAYSLGAPPVFLLFGAPFVLVGVYIIAGRFFYDMLRRSRTAYGLTGERLLVLSGIVSPSIKAFSIAGLPAASLSTRPDRRGTITFGPTNIFEGMRFGMTWRVGASQGVPPLELVENASDVYQTLQELQQNHRRATIDSGTGTDIP